MDSNNLKTQKLNLKALYMELGKLTFKYMNKSCNLTKYNDESKSIYVKIKKTKSKIKYLNSINLEAQPKSDNESLKYEGYTIYKFCKNCMTGNDPNAQICIYCGEKFNK